MAELVVTTADGSVLRYRLGRQAIVGRHPDCEVVVTDPMASRRHCKIEQAAGNLYFVEDTGSANGTSLNGEFLRQRMPFRPNDVLQIGATSLVLQLEPAEIPLPGSRGAGAPSGAGPVPAGAGGSADGAYGAPPKPPAPIQDPSVSIVRLKEDLAGDEVAFDYATSAEVKVVSEDEAASADLRQLQQVTQRLRLMLDLGQSLGSSLIPRKLLEMCLDKLFGIFPQAERGFILLLGPGGELPSTLAPRQETDDALEERRGPLSVSKIRNPQPGDENEVRVSRTVVNKVRQLRQSVLLSDSATDSGYAPAVSLLRLEIRSVMCAPLIAAGEVLGLLYLDTKDAHHRFNPDDVNLLTAVAGQIAVVLKNAELARLAVAEAASRQNLQRYISPHLVERILKKEINVELGGSLKNGTVFFSDLVGFTRLASQMRPNDVVTLLNRYFRIMQGIIFSRGGTVDKFGGDQIMAFWGVLVNTPHAEAAASAAALEMQNAMFLFNRDLANSKDMERPPEALGHGIGLNTGDFIAGNIGSEGKEHKIEFTVIGNAVNLAQRLESIAGRGQAFLGYGTYDRIRERALAFRLPDCPVKNVSMPLQVYSLRGLLPPTRDEATAGPADPTGLTSRLDTGAGEMLYSLPCVLEAQGEAPVMAVVTRIAFNRTERRGRLQLLAERPLPIGVAAHLRWTLHEKPSLNAVDGTIEHTWAPENDAPPGEPTRPTQPMAMIQGALVLRAEGLPEDILSFRAGLEMPSDLTSHEQIIRA
jgi:adenylate cyclase